MELWYRQMQRLVDVPEGEYIVFEHAPFAYALDTEPEHVFYFYHDCTRYWKYVRPVRRLT